LLLLAGLEIQGAEATVAVGLERAHAEFFGQGEGLAVTFSSLIAPRRLTLRRNIAEEAQGIRLVAAFLVFIGECQLTLGEGMCFLTASERRLLP
jgi:hypothetical protein